MLEDRIYTALAAGSPPPTDAQDRVYPILAPEGTELPRITYTRVSTTPANSLDGHAGLDSVRVQIDCWARTARAAATLAAQVRKAMKDQPFKALPQAQQPGFDPEPRIHRHTVEFTCWDKDF